MSSPQGSLLLTVYAPALVDSDSRPLAVVRAMESAIPGLHLDWTISDEGRVIPVPKRETWLARGRQDRTLPLLCNGHESYRMTVTGWERPAGISPGRQAQFEIHVELPLDTAGVAAAADVLEGVAEGAHAFWGHATPDSAMLDIAQQTSPTWDGPPAPARGLPALKLFDDIPTPQLPYHLGWLNYWPGATARVLGYPSPADDAEWLSRSRRTASGGWLVRLTEAPLDLDNPEHLRTLQSAYTRFPSIGGRSAPG